MGKRQPNKKIAAGHVKNVPKKKKEKIAVLIIEQQYKYKRQTYLPKHLDDFVETLLAEMGMTTSEFLRYLLDQELEKRIQKRQR